MSVAGAIKIERPLDQIPRDSSWAAIDQVLTDRLRCTTVIAFTTRDAGVWNIWVRVTLGA